MSLSLRIHVWQRALSYCEYCQISQDSEDTVHEVDHVIAEKHGGQTVSDNLALACFHCNNRKGPNIAGIDPETGQISRLFHPRRDEWITHFSWHGPELVGLTPVGRCTI